MDRKKHFERYYSRFMWEAIIKSVLYGASIGFTVGFGFALGTWFSEFNGFWYAIGLTVVCTAISAVIFYFTIFRPTVASNAKRIDRYGLEERLVTMLELEGSDSYIAKLQREDAAEQLSKISVKQIKIKISKLAIILASIAFVFGTGMTTVNGLAEIGILPSGNDFLNEILPEPEPEFVEVTYMVYEGGTIEGDEVQVIVKGGKTEPIIAKADDGYAFDSWDDGGKKPTRSDSNVTESVVYTAIFLPLGESGEGEGEGDQAGDQPGKGDQPGQYEGEGEGDSNSPNGKPNKGAGGEYLECNQVIDGETYYGSIYDQYYENALGELTSNAEMSGEVKDFISRYYEIIHASDNSDKGGKE